MDSTKIHLIIGYLRRGQLQFSIKLLYHNEKILNPNKRGQPLASVAAPHIYGEISAMVVLVHYLL